MCHDAAVLVSAGGASLLHGNDARLTVGQARRAALECGGRLDVMAVQMASATWHPICYDYPPEQIREIGAAKRAGQVQGGQPADQAGASRNWRCPSPGPCASSTPRSSSTTAG